MYSFEDKFKLISVFVDIKSIFQRENDDFWNT